MISALTIRRLRATDVATLGGVLARAYASDQNNSERRLNTYLQMVAVATFVADLDGEPVGMVVGNDYGPVAYVSQMAVDPSVQRRGIGTALMDDLIAWADDRGFAAVELDATPPGEPLYRRYGFLDVGQTLVYHGSASGVALPGARPCTAADRAALFALDARAFGADRSEVLRFLIDSAHATVMVTEAQGVVTGYAVAQRRPQLLGPVVASDPLAAALLIDAARAHLLPAHRISVPAENPAVGPILTERGYRFARSLAHMVRGTRPQAIRNELYARINLGQG